MPEAPHPLADLRTRRAPVRPTSIDPEARQFTAVIATDAPVPVTLPDGRRVREVLTISRDAVDLSRVTAGAVPLLDGHQQGTRAVLGRLLRATLEPGRLVGTFQFTTADDAEPLWQRVQDGSLATTSAGYTVQKYADAERGPDGVPVLVALRWTLAEVSLVSIPADAGATVRGDLPNPAPEEGLMPDTTPPAPPAPDTAVRAERARIASLEAPAQQARERGMDATSLAALRARAIEEGLDAGAFKAMLFDAIAKGRAFDAQAREEQKQPGFQPRPVSQYLGSYDDPEAQNARRAGAIMARALGIKPADDAREYMGARLVDHARELLTAGGARLSRYESDAAIVTRALSTSDFAGLLQASAERSLQQLIAADTPVRAMSRRREVRDFRQVEAITFSGPGSLAVVAEGAEVTHSPPAERREVGRVKTYARQIQLTREALINDDLGAFADPLRLFASAVAETEGAEFVAMFATNAAGWGPTMSDGDPLFHSNHGNVASGTVSTTGLASARLVMRAQQLPGGGLARVTPRHMLVGPSGETAAEQALNQTSIATTEGDRPVFGGRLQLHVEPRLSGAPWFLAADPSEAAVFEFVTLAGTNGIPVIETFDTGPNHLGVAMRVVHDFAVLPAGWVGWVRATGA